jgi:hypothetical protein
MKRLFLLSTILCCFLFACKKESFITSPNASIVVAGGLDTLRFDTVFTSVGSITQAFTIVNDNNQKLRLSQVKLMGGSNSPFKINVNGSAGETFNDIEINSNDSIYVFVKLTIDPTAGNLPFVVNDSIQIEYNGSVSKLHLQAFGQNAHFLSNWHVTKDSVWDNQLPYVLLNPLYVDEGARLTLQKGVRIYSSANAAFIVNGSLRAQGGKNEDERIIFRGNRLDYEYKDLPGGWGGIVFNPTSTNNVMDYTNVLNAYQAVSVINGPTLTMNQCIIENAYDIGLQGINATINATNCRISQCGNDGVAGVGGNNVLLIAGNYKFNYCTLVTYANLYQNHKQPVLHVSNTDGVNAVELTATFTNTIIYGEGGLVEDEIIINKGNAPLSAVFTNVLYKVKNDPATTLATFVNSVKNANPLFDSVNTSRRSYNFRLREESPAKDTGLASFPPIATDLDGLPRLAGIKPDMGCYEKQ